VNPQIDILYNSHHSSLKIWTVFLYRSSKSADTKNELLFLVSADLSNSYKNGIFVPVD
jgi:hypothetical protein